MQNILCSVASENDGNIKKKCTEDKIFICKCDILKNSIKVDLSEHETLKWSNLGKITTKQGYNTFLILC